MDLTVDRNSLRIIAKAQRAELVIQQARNAAKLAMPNFPPPVPCGPDTTGKDGQFPVSSASACFWQHFNPPTFRNASLESIPVTFP